ncbi:hypothetical protein N9089_03470 [Crocinitomicaceae bacterium]|nr:hypothetical protein [Crocinitomicaceae bacterium]
MELAEPNSIEQQAKEATKGSKVFSLLRLIIGKLYGNNQNLTIERTSLLLDTASCTWVAKPTKIIALESEAEQKDGRLNLTVKGKTLAEPDIQVPFRLYCSFDQEDLPRNLRSDFSALWSLSLPQSIVHQVSPMFLHNAVFSLRLHSTNPSGSKQSICSGRGFLLFGSAEEVTVH